LYIVRDLSLTACKFRYVALRRNYGRRNSACVSRCVHRGI